MAGFRALDPRLQLAGVVLNRVTAASRELLEEVLEQIGVRCLGCLPNDPSLISPVATWAWHQPMNCASSNHGLNTGPSWPGIWRWMCSSSCSRPSSGPDPIQTALSPALTAAEPLPALPVAVAQDEAHFRYPEMQECLEALNMPVLPWSPLADVPPPEEARAWCCRGFPELHAAQLSGCAQSFSALHAWIQTKPIYAECGGMLLLGQSLADPEGRQHPMAGLLPFEAKRGRLQVGYRTLEVTSDTLLMRQGEQLRGHEFHRWTLARGRYRDGQTGPLWQVELEDQQRAEGWNRPNLHASWVHLHWAGSSTISCRWRAALASAASRNDAVG